MNNENLEVKNISMKVVRIEKMLERAVKLRDKSKNTNEDKSKDKELNKNSC